MPANAGIQVTDSVRHTVGKRYPGHGLDPGFHRGDEPAWIPAGAGMTEAVVKSLIVSPCLHGQKRQGPHRGGGPSCADRFVSFAL
jgi:hypothetical protein